MPDITHISKCRLCGQQFKAVAQGVPIIGEPQEKQMVKFLGGVFQHLASKHMAHPQLQELIGFAILACIESPDPAVQEAQKNARHNMHRRTVDPKWGPQPFPDEVLQHAIAGIGLETEQAAHVMKLVTEVRDALLEQPVTTAETANEPASIQA